MKLLFWLPELLAKIAFSFEANHHGKLRLSEISNQIEVENIVHLDRLDGGGGGGVVGDLNPSLQYHKFLPKSSIGRSSGSRWFDASCSNLLTLPAISMLVVRLKVCFKPYTRLSI